MKERTYMLRSVFIISLLIVSFGATCFAGDINLGDHSVNAYAYIQIKYNNSEAATDQFSVPRARFDLWGNIGGKSAYFLEVDAASSQPLVYSWIEYKISDRDKLTIGRMFYPFSLEYMTTPNNFDTINPTNALWSYFGYSRDIGIMASGKYDLFKYYIGAVNGADYVFNDDNETKDIVGRFVFYPLKDLGLGASFYDGKSGTMEADKRVQGFELSYKNGPLLFKSEVFSGDLAGVYSTGWYLQPAYYVADGVQLLIKYELWNSDTSDLDNTTYATTYALNWFYDSNSKLMLNYIVNKEETAETKNDEILAQLQLSF